MRTLLFRCHPPRRARRHAVTEPEIRVVLERLPSRLSERLTTVHFNDRARGNRRLGYVSPGRDEISLCAIPNRVSMASFLERNQSPAAFGALRGGQWPGLAVRRFMLYDVFLHELGHLQIINPKARNTRRRFADETRAQQFADRWRRELWARPFDHPDPIHNPPTPEETETLRSGWIVAHGAYKKGLLHEKEGRYEEAVMLFTRAVERFPGHAMALERLGLLTYVGKGTTQSTARSIELLGAAVQNDPSLCDANLFLGLALSRENRQAEARRCFERALPLDRHSPLVMSMYADSLADWGLFTEAEALFQKAMKRDERCVLALRDYARSLVREHNPDADANLGRAVGLFERAVALDPSDAESHYRLGDALLCVEGETKRAMGHLERALRINPAHAKAALVLAEADAGRADPAEC